MIIKPHKNGSPGGYEPVLVNRFGVPLHRYGASPVTLDYKENPTAQAPGSAAQAAAVTLVTSNVLKFDGSTKLRLEFFCQDYDAPNCTTCIDFWLDAPATDLGIATKQSTAAGYHTVNVLALMYYTPPAGVGTISVRCWRTGSTGTFHSTSTGYPAVYLRINAA